MPFREQVKVHLMLVDALITLLVVHCIGVTSAQCPVPKRDKNLSISSCVLKCNSMPLGACVGDLFWQGALPHLFKLGSPTKVGLETAPHESKARKPKNGRGVVRLLFHQLWYHYSSFGFQDILECMCLCVGRDILKWNEG